MEFFVSARFFSQPDSYQCSLIDKDMIGELISWVKNGKAAGPSGVVSKMIKIAAEAAVDMITD